MLSVITEHLHEEIIYLKDTLENLKDKNKQLVKRIRTGIEKV